MRDYVSGFSFDRRLLCCLSFWWSSPRPRKVFIMNVRTNGESRKGAVKGESAARRNGGRANPSPIPAPNAPSPALDLTEITKALLQIAREQGQLTYDDINEILPDGVSPDALDALYTRLHELGIEVAARAEVETPKPEEPEPEEERQLDALDDPVRMYMNQMAKVPLLTREQEVEVCKRIEEAGFDMKRLVYGLGFAAKEHNAIAEKLLSEPPRERFDCIALDTKT